jgi:voltage-gated potassium channel Kch
MLARLAKLWRKSLEARSSVQPHQMDVPDQHAAHVIVAGFGRVGTLVAEMLREQKLGCVGVDFDVGNVTRGRKSGHTVYFGDAANMAFLESCGLRDAKALAITMDSPGRTEHILRLVRQQHPDLKIITRARDERHAQSLYEAGATEAVPETIEASLQLAEALLVETGLPMGLAIAAVHERRDQSRKLLGRPNRREEIAKARSRLRKTLKP